MHSLLDGKKSHVLCKNNSVGKTVNDRLLKTPVSALPSGIVSVDVPSPSVVAGVANWRPGRVDSRTVSGTVEPPITNTEGQY